mgnify:CR=1 FL=1
MTACDIREQDPLKQGLKRVSTATPTFVAPDS